MSDKDQHVSLINNISSSTYNTCSFYQHALDSGQEMRQDLNENASHPLGTGVHVFLLLLQLTSIFIKFCCILSHWHANNGKTNPVAHSFIVPHLPSSSGSSLCKWKRCKLPIEKHSCSSRSNIPPLPLLPLGPPRTAGSAASNAHSRGTERGHQGQKMT